jgi:outer membrane protein assembly factor BamB
MSNGVVCTSGFWIALDKNTGNRVWSTCNPVNSQVRNALTVVKGGVVFASAMNSMSNKNIINNVDNGDLYGLDAQTGAILWNVQSGASNNAGPAITNGLIMWGTGYVRYGQGVHGNTMIAFEVPSRVVTTSAPTTTTTAAPGTPTTTTTATPTSTIAPPYQCWTCPPGYVHCKFNFCMIHTFRVGCWNGRTLR